MPCTPGRNPDRPIVTFVRDLVDEDRKWWNEELIDKIFDSQTARVIKQISLGSINNLDCVRWKETQLGEYSIRSDYALELKKPKIKGGRRIIESGRDKEDVEKAVEAKSTWKSSPFHMESLQ